MEKTYPVIFNDNHTHDGFFASGQYAELNEAQYKVAKGLGCGYNADKPLITDCEKRNKETDKPVTNDKPVKV